MGGGGGGGGRNYPHTPLSHKAMAERQVSVQNEEISELFLVSYYWFTQSTRRLPLKRFFFWLKTVFSVSILVGPRWLFYAIVQTKYVQTNVIYFLLIFLPAQTFQWHVMRNDNKFKNKLKTTLRHLASPTSHTQSSCTIVPFRSWRDQHNFS